MSKLNPNFKIDPRSNTLYNEKTGLIDNNTVDYRIDEKYIKKYPIKFYKKKDIPQGICGHYQFQIDNYYYTFGGGSSGTHGGCHLWPLLDNEPGKFNNKLLRYDLEKDIWKDLGNIENIYKRGLGSYWVYNKKMYVLGGMAWEYTDKKYLDEHMKKYGKWPEKKGEWYSDDMWEIDVDNNDKIITKKIIFPIFTNYVMSALCINDKVYLIGGMFGKYQKSYMSVKLLQSYLQNPICKKKVEILGDTYFSGQVLFYIDMKNIQKGLQVESIFPGIPCTNICLEEYKNYLYIFSNYTFNNSSLSTIRPGEKNRMTCSDNWKYNLDKKEWIRINNNPLKGYIGYNIKKINKKYALIFGGVRGLLHTSIDNFKNYNYTNFLTNEPEILKFEKDKNNVYNISESELKPYFKYGTITNHFSYFNSIDQKDVIDVTKIKSYDYFQHYFSDIIMFYNFEEDKFYLSNYHLPYNIVGIMLNPPILNNNIFLIGGESNDTLFNSKCHYTNNNLCIKLECDEINK